jgi:hypothetical protein
MILRKQNVLSYPIVLSSFVSVSLDVIINKAFPAYTYKNVVQEDKKVVIRSSTSKKNRQ